MKVNVMSDILKANDLLAQDIKELLKKKSKSFPGILWDRPVQEKLRFLKG
ncbi:hypothetical protein ES705_12371 [subsurface metagenome]